MRIVNRVPNYEKGTIAIRKHNTNAKFDQMSRVPTHVRSYSKATNIIMTFAAENGPVNGGCLAVNNGSVFMG